MIDRPDDTYEAGRERPQPGLFDRPGLRPSESLPWLESADDAFIGETGGNIAVGRLAMTAGVAILLLMVAGGLGYWFIHRAATAYPADGSLIAAPTTPYKVRPADPGGKTFEGTGDSSYVVGEGGSPGAAMSDDDATVVAPSPLPTPVASPSATPSEASGGGVGVQVGAYSTRELAETGWATLIRDHEALSGVGHRVVEGTADIGHVFRLQAVAQSASAARDLCGRLQADGLKCQVKQ